MDILYIDKDLVFYIKYYINYILFELIEILNLLVIFN